MIMRVQCAICCYPSTVIPRHIWASYGRKYPDVWICDVCYKEI